MILDIETIRKRIQQFESGPQKRLSMLYDYYIGKQAIQNETKTAGKPNNKLVTNYCKNIVTNTVGYFMGIPIKYDCTDSSLQTRIDDITEYNDDALINTELAIDTSTFGIAAEMLWIDADGEIRYTQINPMQLYVETAGDVENTIIYAIRWYDVKDLDQHTTRHIEVFDKNSVEYYIQHDGGNITPEEVDGQDGKKTERPHYFGEVPINIYYNNKQKMGDFEGIISLQDAYNTMESESVNDYQSFADAILLLKNVKVPTHINEETGMEEADDLRDTKVLETYDKGEASYLIKQVNDAYVENIKERIKTDLFVTSNTVDMTDETFSGATTGASIERRMINFESRVAMTERYFRKALQRRFELICNVLNIKGANADYRDIKIKFKRNVPADMTEIIQLKDIVSDKTLLSQIRFVDNVEAELEQIKKERDSYDMSNFGRDDKLRPEAEQDNDIDYGNKK